MLSKHRHDGAWTLQDYRLPKGCWLHILHIIILTISYTHLNLALRCRLVLSFEKLLRIQNAFWLCCLYSTGVWLKCCVLGSDHPGDLLHHQNPSLISNFSTFLDVKIHVWLECPLVVACVHIVSAAIRGEKWQRYPISWYRGCKSLWSCSSSIPLGLASASSHSALAGLGLYTVNTPSLMSWHH